MTSPQLQIECIRPVSSMTHGPGQFEACWQAQASVQAVQAQLPEAAPTCPHLQPALQLLEQL